MLMLVACDVPGTNEVTIYPVGCTTRLPLLRIPFTILLYRSGKQQFCTRTCVNRAGVRRWRATAHGKQNEKARAASRYRQSKRPASVRHSTPKKEAAHAKRRANHEGTIYKRQDGRWTAAVVLPGGRQKSSYGKTREAVAQKLTNGLKAVQDGLPIPSDQLQDMDLVFANEIGKPMDARNVLHRSLWPLLEQAGLPRIRFHDLRHTAATLLLQQGVHAKVVSTLLGHSSIGLPLDTSSHVLPDMQH